MKDNTDRQLVHANDGIGALRAEVYDQFEECMKLIDHYGSEATETDRDDIEEPDSNNGSPARSDSEYPHHSANRTSGADMDENDFNDTKTVCGNHEHYRRYKPMLVDPNKEHDDDQRDLNDPPGPQ